MRTPVSHCGSGSCWTKRTKRARVVTLAWSLGVAVLGVSAAAHASPDYPADIKSYWRISSLPVSGMGCMLCHSTDLGETGTVVRPFGKTMQAHGLMPEDPKSLYAALGYITQHSTPPDMVDSDGDGVSDFNEIYYDHTNPNDPNDFKAPPPVDTMPSGGAGGDSGEETGDTGGQSASQEPPLPPVFAPPSAADLPPPFVHGCATAPLTSPSDAAFTALFAAACALGCRRKRAR